MYLLIEDHKDDSFLRILSASLLIDEQLDNRFNFQEPDNDSVLAIVAVGCAMDITPGDIYWKIHGGRDEQSGGGFEIIKSK